MDIRKIDDSISVAPQITPDQVAELASMGFKTLVANRPDQEEPGQPAMAELEKAARDHGLEWVFLPVESSNIVDGDVDAFATMFGQAEKPVLAFCRSGTRSSVLWALSAARYMPIEPIIQRTGQAGYDLRGLVSRLQHQAASHQG